MTEPQWVADIAIDAALAASLVREQFPEFRDAAVRPFGIGWDNAAFLVGERTLFRFPRRRIAVALIEREAAILPLIAPRLPLAVSAPAFIGNATSKYPWRFAGYPLIRGVTACADAESSPSRDALAEPLGRFLRALHHLETPPLVAAGLPPDEIGRLDHAKRLPMTRERLRALEDAGLVEGAGAFVQWMERHPPEPLADGLRTIVHGDLYARHVLIDGDHPTGIIDWGDVHLGDPALDVAIAHLMLPQAAHAAFRQAYGGVDERTWTVARYRAIYHAVLELDYGVRAEDAGMRAIGIAALQLVRPAIA